MTGNESGNRKGPYPKTDSPSYRNWHSALLASELFCYRRIFFHWTKMFLKQHAGAEFPTVKATSKHLTHRHRALKTLITPAKPRFPACATTMYWVRCDRTPGKNTVTARVKTRTTTCFSMILRCSVSISLFRRPSIHHCRNG